ADAGEDAARRGIDPFGSVSGKQVGKIGHGRSFSSGEVASNFVCRCRWQIAGLCDPPTPTNSNNTRGHQVPLDLEIPAEAKAIGEKVRKWVHDECIPAEKEL